MILKLISALKVIASQADVHTRYTKAQVQSMKCIAQEALDECSLLKETDGALPVGNILPSTSEAIAYTPAFTAHIKQMPKISKKQIKALQHAVELMTDFIESHNRMHEWGKEVKHAEKALRILKEYKNGN